MTKLLAVFALFFSVLPAYSSPRTAYYPTLVVFDGNRNPRKSVVQFIPSKIQLERSDFFNKAVEIRGEWFYPKKRNWSPIIEVTGAEIFTNRSEPAVCKIWNMGGLLPPEEMQPFRFDARRGTHPVYYETQPTNLSGILEAARKGSRIFMNLLVRVNSRPGKILLPAFSLPR